MDVFKHFKIMPTQDWKVNKKQGDVSEIFVSDCYQLTCKGQRNRQEGDAAEWDHLSEQLYLDPESKFHAAHARPNWKISVPVNKSASLKRAI